MPQTRSDRVLWAIHELGLQNKLKLKEIDLYKGEQLAPDFVSMNQLSEVPVLILTEAETGKKHAMTESCTIPHFLAEKTESDLLPPICNSFARAQYFRIIGLTCSTIDTLISTIVFNEFVAQDSKDLKAAARAREDFANKPAKALNEIFASKDADEPVQYILEPYHKGFTIADIVLGNILIISEIVNLLDDYPYLQAYVNRLKQRPAYQSMRKE